MKTGIYRWFGYDLKNDYNFRIIKDAGFDNVLLWWDEQFEPQEGGKESAPDMARNAGLYIENIHLPFLRANSLWEKTPKTKEVLAEFINCAKACSRFEIPTMVFHLTYGYTPPAYGKTGLDNMKRLMDAAEKYGVDIALENLRRPDYIGHIIEDIDSERLKLCYDAGHENCFAKTDMLQKYGNRLTALHLHDNDGSADQHMIPGDGNIDWRNVADKIKNTGFKGSVTLECMNTGQEEYKGLGPEEFLAKAYESAVSLAKLMET